MRNCLLLAVFFICVTATHSQGKRNSSEHPEHINFHNLLAAKLKTETVKNLNSASNHASNKNETVIIQFAPQKIQLTKITPFLNFSCGWNEVDHAENNSTISIRFSENGVKWNQWIELQKEGHYERTNYSFVSQLLELDQQVRYYQISITSNQNKKGNSIEYLFLNFFSPGDIIPNETSTGISPTGNTQFAEDVTACPCPQPAFTNRIGWGCTQVWNPSTTNVTHLIVHHSAGTNTSTDWGAVVLGIWNFHTTTQGYSDIGYNWLIAPNGVLYEGRYKSSTDDISGAHFCSTNGNTMGVCMLGTFTSQTITAAARNTLTRLLAWKGCQKNIVVTGSSFHAGSGLTINHISGHRDGCSTECPGNLFYPDLPGIRTGVQAYIDADCLLTQVIEINGLEKFSVLPNPVAKNAILTVKLNTAKQVQYRLLRADGSMIYSSARQLMKGLVTIEIKELQNQPQGNYLLQVFFNDDMVTKKLVKQ
jgi:N-acetylmuramoyl-L-alanine amidase